MRKVTKGAVTIKLWDVGGQPRFRTMWERYCRGVQAIVYVVDAADHDALEQSAGLLLELMARPSLAGLPLLVLANKNDLPGALSAEDVRDRMRLQVRARGAALEGQAVTTERARARRRSAARRSQCSASRARTSATSTSCWSGSQSTPRSEWVGVERAIARSSALACVACRCGTHTVRSC